MAVLYEINGSTGGGHEMLPDPEATGAAAPSEATVVSAVNGAVETNDNVASLYGIQQWSNVKRIRVLYAGTIGHTGIGAWKDGEVTPSDEADWWENDAFMLLDNSSPAVSGYDVDFSIKLDPGSGEVITLGGYIIDTHYDTGNTDPTTGDPIYTGKMCIRFANYVIDPAQAKIAVDITFTRNQVG